jgi:hypothetical protein
MPYTKQQTRAEITKLVDHFRANESSLADVPEAQIEADYIRKLFRYLNWNTDNTGLSVSEWEFVLQRTDEKGKRPDYILQLDGHQLLVMDAKKVKYDMHDPRWMMQVYAYAYSTQNQPTPRKIDFAILTDFQEFILLDCTLYAANPKAVNNFRILDWTCDDYVREFDTLWELFEQENLRRAAARSRGTEQPSGLWSRYLSPKKVKANRIPPDKSFLSEMDDEKTGWRVRLAKDMKKLNPGAAGALITAAVQLLIDRLIFVKALSDREIEADYLTKLAEQVEKSGLAADSASWFSACRSIFTRLNKFYNGSVFEPRPELEAVTVSNKVVRGVIRDLQPENSPYNFAMLPVEILGTIYERFLGRVVHATEKQVKIQDKPEVRKAGGVYYTPQYIVDYIVQNTLGELLAKCKNPSEVAKLRILDPACGSGSFLLGAYTALIRWHVDYYTARKLKHKDRQAAYYDRDNGVRLTAKLKRQILLTNLFGVDIDAQAVEVTRFSLSLKALEDTRRDELLEEASLFKQTVLPDLSGNIKCGNSLIGTDYFAGQMFTTPDELLTVRPFDWAHEFPTIVAAGGFDAVIGNPPYLNIDDTWGKGDSRLAALKASYPHIYNDKTDILFYFLGKASELCKGRVSFIVSRAFLEAYKADKLREYLVSYSAITQIIDFRNLYVFSGVGITTCIITYQPGQPPASVEVYKLRPDELPSLALSTLLANDNVFDHIEINQCRLTSASWALTSPAITSLNVKIDAAGEALGQILIIGQGMQTGRNDVFGMRTQEEIAKWRVKPLQFYKRASNSDIQRYFIRDRGEYILYPQAASSFDELPAGVKKHLVAHADRLKKRAAYLRGDCEWWKFTWPLHEVHYGRKRIICPYLATFNRFALDEQGEFLSLTDTTVLFENGQLESLLYLLGVLNSKLLSFRFMSIGKLKSGGIYEYFWNSVSKLPIRRITFSDPADKERHDTMVQHAQSMLALQHHKAAARTQAKLEQIQRQIDATDRQIDTLVYELYGLTSDEIAVVENAG